MIFIGYCIGFELFKLNFFFNSKSLMFVKLCSFIGLIINLPVVSTISFAKATSYSRKYLFSNIDQG